MNLSPWLLFPVLFIGMWVGILFFFSRLGWADLASVYRAERPFEGRRWHWVSAQVGKVNWRSSLMMGANGEGLFLAPMKICFPAVGHPALFIPWSDLRAVWKRWLGFEWVQLTARGAPDAGILIQEPQARALALAAGTQWPAPDLLAQIEIRRATVDRGRTAAAYAAIGAIVFFGVAAGIGSLIAPEYEKLDRTGETAAALVTSVEPENHNSLRYAYTIAGTRYEGIGSIADEGREPIRVGDSLTIHYVPAEPTISCLGDPHAFLINTLAGAGSGAIFLAFAVVFGLRSTGFAIRRPSNAAR